MPRLLVGLARSGRLVASQWIPANGFQRAGQLRTAKSHRELSLMPFYENVFIARQDVTTAQVEGLTDLFAGIITAQGGNVTKREYWGLKGLSYRVRKNRKGHYTLLNIDAPARSE